MIITVGCPSVSTNSIAMVSAAVMAPLASSVILGHGVSSEH
jgi:hypothetical protein